jgi:hypothetical protein
MIYRHANLQEFLGRYELKIREIDMSGYRCPDAAYEQILKTIPDTE